jgi:AcrR family transcriptional regulator
MPRKTTTEPGTDDLPDESNGLPPGIALAWGLNTQPKRGPKPGLSLERLVTAGIKVALTEGTGALSMSRIAKELGVATMSLYRYVSSKDELLTLMVDKALGTPPIPSDQEDWRAGLTGWALGVRAAYRRHPWGLRVPITEPPLGPNNVAWLEAALHSLADTPLSEQHKVSSVLLISGYVRSQAMLAADIDAASAAGPARLSYGRLLARLTDDGHYPSIHRVIDSGAFDDGDDLDADFDYGLARILDGIENFIRPSRSKRVRPRT